jgi:hypothetical protein
MRIDSDVVEPFDFAAVGARQPTSRARAPAVSLRTIARSVRRQCSASVAFDSRGQKPPLQALHEELLPLP